MNIAIVKKIENEAKLILSSPHCRYLILGTLNQIKGSSKALQQSLRLL